MPKKRRPPKAIKPGGRRRVRNELGQFRKRTVQDDRTNYFAQRKHLNDLIRSAATEDKKLNKQLNREIGPGWRRNTASVRFEVGFSDGSYRNFSADSFATFFATSRNDEYEQAKERMGGLINARITVYSYGEDGRGEYVDTGYEIDPGDLFA